MLRLFQFLIDGCAHVWEDTGEGHFKYTDDNGHVTQTSVVVYCKCKKCGKHTHFEDARMKKVE